MEQRDYRDILGGALLLLAGVFIAWHAASTLSLGSMRRMGPGLFPMSSGCILAAFGLAIMIPAFFRRGGLPSVEWRPAFGVLAGVVAFGATIRTFGLVPAIVVLLLVTSLAEQRFRPLTLAAMCVLLPLTAYLLFRVGLGLPLVMTRWPF